MLGSRVSPKSIDRAMEEMDQDGSGEVQFAPAGTLPLRVVDSLWGGAPPSKASCPSSLQRPRVHRAGGCAHVPVGRRIQSPNSKRCVEWYPDMGAALLGVAQAMPQGESIFASCRWNTRSSRPGLRSTTATSTRSVSLLKVVESSRLLNVVESCATLPLWQCRRPLAPRLAPPPPAASSSGCICDCLQGLSGAAQR